MSRHRWVIGGTGAALILVLAVASTSIASQARSQQSAKGSGALVTFTVVERATTDTVIDVGDPGDSIGDSLAFGNKLYNAANTNRVGRDEGSCVRTNPGVAWECSWTNLLPRGHLTVQGPFYDDGRDSMLSITGGTGHYADASGQMRLHWRDALGTEFDFVFMLGD